VSDEDAQLLLWRPVSAFVAGAARASLLVQYQLDDDEEGSRAVKFLHRGPPNFATVLAGISRWFPFVWGDSCLLDQTSSSRMANTRIVVGGDLAALRRSRVPYPFPRRPKSLADDFLVVNGLDWKQTFKYFPSPTHRHCF
jgi:hypothetical protein